MKADKKPEVPRLEQQHPDTQRLLERAGAADGRPQREELTLPRPEREAKP